MVVLFPSICYKEYVNDYKDLDFIKEYRRTYIEDEVSTVITYDQRKSLYLNQGKLREGGSLLNYED